MELNIPSQEQAYWGLRTMKTVALADGVLDDSELHLSLGRAYWEYLPSRGKKAARRNPSYFTIAHTFYPATKPILRERSKSPVSVQVSSGATPGSLSSLSY